MNRITIACAADFHARCVLQAARAAADSSERNWQAKLRRIDLAAQLLHGAFADERQRIAQLQARVANLKREQTRPRATVGQLKDERAVIVERA